VLVWWHKQLFNSPINILLNLSKPLSLPSQCTVCLNKKGVVEAAVKLVNVTNFVANGFSNVYLKLD
jgi:hypothetical protein